MRSCLCLKFRQRHCSTYTLCVRKSIHTEQQRHLQDLLRQVRQDAGLTQISLAERLETAHSRISDYERGERRLDLLQLREYCQALGVPLQEFVKRFEDSLPAETDPAS